MPQPENLAAKLALSSERWSPEVVARLNGHEVMVARTEGAFTWHVHEGTDDLFPILEGHVRIETDQGDVKLGTSEFHVPKGVRHRPVSKAEAHVLPIEAAGRSDTGDPTTAAVKAEI